MGLMSSLTLYEIKYNKHIIFFLNTFITLTLYLTTLDQTRRRTRSRQFGPFSERGDMI